MTDTADSVLANALRDRYVLERELGRGGMATVYFAHDLRHDRPVALKVLHRELAATLGPERFLREIRTTARLDHPHILPVFDSGEAGGLLWYTMPYVDGETLRGRLRREVQLPVDEAVRLAGEVADALDYAHRHGVVHRDVKPENILLSEGHARVADFGVARALEAASGSQLTETGLAVGTPTYMSPEQASAGTVDARSDVYALGCVVYEMLAGEPPYSGPTPQAILAKRFTDPVPSIHRIRDVVPDLLDRAISKALARLPADRFQTAAEFGRAITAEHGIESRSVTTPTATPTSTPEPAAARRPRRPPVHLTLAFVLGLLAVATLGLLLRQRSQRTGDAAPVSGSRQLPIVKQPSVAVLPFTNLSPSREDEYFSDGMTEELITALGRIEGLRVAARASSFTFKGTHADVRDVAQRLNVGAVLDGSVRRAGLRLRVTAELVDAREGTRLWADSYDRELRDIFAVQDDLARAIADALKVRLTHPGGAPLVARPTKSLAAHDSYLQGRFFWNQRTASALLTAVRYFERAIQHDSAYAEAYAGLADCYAVFPSFEVTPPREAYSKAAAAALRALALDSTLGQAHAALGLVRANSEWDWRSAEREYRHAIALAPSYPTAHQWYAEYLNTIGLNTEALAEVERALALDPLSRQIGVVKGRLLLASRRYDEAIAQLRKTLELDPYFARGHFWLGQAYLAKGSRTEALTELEKAERQGQRAEGLLAYTYALLGQRERAHALVRDLTARAEREYASPYLIAVAYIGLGERNHALRWLELATDMRDPATGPANWLNDPLLDPLRSDPRFNRLLTRMGLKPAGVRPSG
jgi:serine/threonine protein kinase/tetratricopeptide (TPR) repeat protein